MKLPKIPYDKALHLIYGLVIFIVTYFITNLLIPFPFISVLCGFGMVFIIGFGKEIYDHQNKDRHTSDIVDAMYTIVGGLLGFIVYLITLI